MSSVAPVVHPASNCSQRQIQVLGCPSLAAGGASSTLSFLYLVVVAPPCCCPPPRHCCCLCHPPPLLSSFLPSPSLSFVLPRCHPSPRSPHPHCSLFPPHEQLLMAVVGGAVVVAVVVMPCNSSCVWEDPQLRASSSTGADDVEAGIGIHPASRCSWQCRRGPVVTTKVGQGATVVPPVPGATQEGSHPASSCSQAWPRGCHLVGIHSASRCSRQRH